MNRLFGAIALLAVATFTLAGCSLTPNTARPSNQSTGSENAGELQSFYDQTITFKECGENLTCSRVSVPLDYASPSANKISIAVVKYSTVKNAPLGALLINPGGPGASGYDWVKNQAPPLSSKKLLRNYDLVGFDPRGVQNSTAIQCYDSAKLDEFLYQLTPYEWGSEKDIAASRESIKEFGKACLQNTGSLLGHVDTISAAKDLDIIRAVLGQNKLNFLGYSYGTLLGATYANLFPQKVGAFVLDGAVDPSVPDEIQTQNQLRGFDLALRDYLQGCDQRDGCQFKGTVEQNLVKIQKFLRGAETKTYENTDDAKRPVNVIAIETGMMMALYDEGYWQYLDTAFDDAMNYGDATMFMRLADYYNDRTEDGKYSSNLNEAFMAISCLDGRSDSSEAAMAAQNAKLLEISPTLGRYWQYGALGCADWPVPEVGLLDDYSATGAPTILVIGNTADPATPYGQAVALAHDVLDKGFLLTLDGEGHTAYDHGHSCIDDVVNAFLIDGTLPKSEPICQPD